MITQFLPKGQVWKWVWILEDWSENRCGKLQFLVWNRVRIWTTGWHNPTKNSREYPPLPPHPGCMLAKVTSPYMYFWLHVRAICNQTLSIVVHSWQKHLDCCILLVVSCTNENCKETMVRKDLDEHVTVTCQWRIIHCSYCGVSLPDCHLKVKSYIVL